MKWSISLKGFPKRAQHRGAPGLLLIAALVLGAPRAVAGGSAEPLQPLLPVILWNMEAVGVGAPGQTPTAEGWSTSTATRGGLNWSTTSSPPLQTTKAVRLNQMPLLRVTVDGIGGNGLPDHLAVAVRATATAQAVATLELSETEVLLQGSGTSRVPNANPGEVVLELDNELNVVRLILPDAAPVVAPMQGILPGSLDAVELSVPATTHVPVSLRVQISALPSKGIYFLTSAAESYRLQPGQHIFQTLSHSWQRLPSKLVGAEALRPRLNEPAPVPYYCRTAGRVYAALWKWDFGFLEQLPAGLAESFDGWTRVPSQEALVRGAPDPFHAIPIYSRIVEPGTGELDLTAYYGQWIVLGFKEEGAGVAIKGPSPTIGGGRTRHNIVDPGAHVTLVGAGSDSHPTLYRRGRLVRELDAPEFSAPEVPGRYVLRVGDQSNAWLLPLTVAYPPSGNAPGWGLDFFPIHFYTGWGYTGLFEPNPDLRDDLQTLSMFDLGATTFFLRGADPVIQALHCRTLLNLRPALRTVTRGKMNDDQAASAFAAAMAAASPFPQGTLGVYAEDEPGIDVAPRLSVLERANLSLDPAFPLVYALHGDAATSFWRTAGSTVRMVRSYPIRKARRADLGASIREELSDYLVRMQSAGLPGRLWVIVQVFGDRGRPNLWDPPTPAQLRLMVSLSLARGARAITYFCYDSSPAARETLSGLVRWPFVPEDGRYEEIRRLDEWISGLAPLISSLTWVAVSPDPASPTLDVQLFAGPAGSRYAWITNLDTTASVSRNVTIQGVPTAVKVVLGPAGSQVYPLPAGNMRAP